MERICCCLSGPSSYMRVDGASSRPPIAWADVGRRWKLVGFAFACLALSVIDAWDIIRHDCYGTSTWQAVGVTTTCICTFLLTCFFLMDATNPPSMAGLPLSERPCDYSVLAAIGVFPLPFVTLGDLCRLTDLKPPLHAFGPCDVTATLRIGLLAGSIGLMIAMLVAWLFWELLLALRRGCALLCPCWCARQEVGPPLAPSAASERDVALEELMSQQE